MTEYHRQDIIGDRRNFIEVPKVLGLKFEREKRKVVGFKQLIYRKPDT